MPTVIAHGLVGLASAGIAPRRFHTTSVLLAVLLCSFLPDLDVTFMAMGIPYRHLLGHRGLSHSFFFALVIGMVAALLVACAQKQRRLGWGVATLCAAVMATHDVLDALTDGGLGVAFFAPFSNTRYFLPWRPIAVAPLNPERMFSPRGFHVLMNEFAWTVLPAFSMLLVAWGWRLWREKKLEKIVSDIG